MTARAAVSLFCDSCSTFILLFNQDVHAQSAISVNRITKTASAKGWLTRNEKGRIYALCPVCRPARARRVG